MAESVYKVIELVGTSTNSWERAASAAVERAAESLRDLRVAEVVEQDIAIKDGRVEAYRVKMRLSFKYEKGDRSAREGDRPAAEPMRRPRPIFSSARCAS